MNLPVKIFGLLERESHSVIYQWAFHLFHCSVILFTFVHQLYFKFSSCTHLLSVTLTFYLSSFAYRLALHINAVFLIQHAVNPFRTAMWNSLDKSSATFLIEWHWYNPRTNNWQHYLETSTSLNFLSCLFLLSFLSLLWWIAGIFLPFNYGFKMAIHE